MSRFPDRATRTRLRSSSWGIAIVALLVLVSGCKELDGRSRNRKANRYFRDKHFIDASAEYEAALKTVNDPIIHYNLGLSYSKVLRAGSDKPIFLGIKGEFVCNSIPGVKDIDASVCVKPDDRHFDECDGDITTEAGKPKKPKTAPAPEKPGSGSAVAAGSGSAGSGSGSGSAGSGSAAVAAGSGSAGSGAGSGSAAGDDEDDRQICAASFRCEKHTMCAISSPVAADYAAQHFLKWLEAHPKDEDTRKLVTAAWLDTEQFDKALEYWGTLLKAKPNDPGIMGVLAGINLKASDWRKSIEWYNKVADLSPDPSGKVAAWQFIGNVAWSKLNSKTLTQPEAIELADRGLTALQKGAALQPSVSTLFGLQASILNFRALNQASSLAAAIDRATAQDLQSHTRVLAEQAKKLKGTGASGSGAGSGAAPTTPTPSMSGRPAEKAGG